MAQDHAQASNGAYYALKEVYGPEIKDQINNDIIFFKLLRKSEEFTPSGRAAFVKVRIEETQGYSAVASYTTAIPDSGASQFRELTVPLARIFGRVGVWHETMLRANKQPGALVRYLDDEKESVMRGLKKDINRQLFGDGTGTLATVSAFGAGSPATYTVDSTYNIKIGMKFDVYRAGVAVTDATALTVIAKLSETRFTATTTGTPQAADIIVRAGAYGSEMQGLAKLIADDNTVQGINRTTDFWWQCVVLQNNVAAFDLSLKKLRILASTIFKRSGMEPDLYIATPDVIDGYGFSMTANRRFMSEGEPLKKFDFGWKGQTFDGKPIVRDADATEQTIYALQTADLFRAPLSDIEWLDEDGLVLRLAENDVAKWEAKLALFDNLCLSRSNSQGKLTNVLGLSEGTYSV